MFNLLCAISLLPQTNNNLILAWLLVPALSTTYAWLEIAHNQLVLCSLITGLVQVLILLSKKCSAYLVLEVSNLQDLVSLISSISKMFPSTCVCKCLVSNTVLPMIPITILNYHMIEGRFQN